MVVGTVQGIHTEFPDSNRTVSLFMINSRHPLNVKPSGNSWLMRDIDPKILPRHKQMGDLAVFPDELLMDILSFVDDEKSLQNLSYTSRIMYAFLYDEEVWRKLYTKRIVESGSGGQDIQWRGSWRCTMLHIDNNHQANLQIPDNLLCSDILYRPYQCSNVDYDKVFHKIAQEEEKYYFTSLENPSNVLDKLPRGRIPRVPEQCMTLEKFNTQWHDKPFILTNGNKERWPRWDLAALLSRFPNVRFRQEAVQWPLSLYAQYLNNNKDESPLYLFDCSSVAMKTLREEYKPPQVFREDLFKVFSGGDDQAVVDGQSAVNCRPDHAWLIVGPKRSGSTFHKDPNYTSAWNTALTGRKLWIMLPPDITPPGVGTDDEESEVTSPVGIAEWVISGFFNDCLKIDQCQIAITFPGECMYVPSGWWHSVINLDDSVALTQNFVPLPKLANALNFFKNRREQISGFRPKEVKEAMDSLINSTTTENENIEKLKEYSEKFNSLELRNQNEDCGEILCSELPPMPIYELFIELLESNGRGEELEQAKLQLARMERKVQGPGKSEVWEKLQQEKSSGFSFGFDDESDEE
ncbi:hypothetical protein CAAN1_01S14290 [[Candida] anglica]|uniref:JmjC domain-containing protein n=1 Tax=[Candida] anglica TaxID=148631 RepID=A0ABP0EM02_9ASCO